MAFWKNLAWVIIILVLLMEVLSPVVLSSRPCSQVGRKYAEGIRTKKELVETKMGLHGFRKGGSVFGSAEDLEDLAREVPTGPDPLHHNKIPTTRP